MAKQLLTKLFTGKFHNNSYLCRIYYGEEERSRPSTVYPEQFLVTAPHIKTHCLDLSQQFNKIRLGVGSKVGRLKCLAFF